MALYYRFSATSTLPDNGYSVIVPNVGTGRWILLRSTSSVASLTELAAIPESQRSENLSQYVLAENAWYRFVATGGAVPSAVGSGGWDVIPQSQVASLPPYRLAAIGNEQINYDAEATAEHTENIEVPSISLAFEIDRVVQPISVPITQRAFALDYAVGAPQGAYSTSPASLLGASGLTSYGAANSQSIALPFAFRFGFSASGTVQAYPDSSLLVAGQTLRLNSKVGRVAQQLYAGGNPDQFRIRGEFLDAVGGNPLIWEVTIFKENVLQIVFGDFGANDGVSGLSNPLTSLPLAANTSYVVQYLYGSTVSYIARSGSYFM